MRSEPTRTHANTTWTSPNQTRILPPVMQPPEIGTEWSHRTVHRIDKDAHSQRH